VDKHYIITEDDVKVYEGDVVYNYYDMRPVIIPEFSKSAIEDAAEAKSLKRDVWLNMEIATADENIRGTDLLNGERICSMAFAKGRGFKGA
jgi:hypothetical protein